MALAVSGVSTGWAAGGPATAAGLCETVAIFVLPCPSPVLPVRWGRGGPRSAANERSGLLPTRTCPRPMSTTFSDVALSGGTVGAVRSRAAMPYRSVIEQCRLLADEPLLDSFLRPMTCGSRTGLGSVSTRSAGLKFSLTRHRAFHRGALPSAEARKPSCASSVASATRRIVSPKRMASSGSLSHRLAISLVARAARVPPPPGAGPGRGPRPSTGRGAPLVPPGPSPVPVRRRALAGEQELHGVPQPMRCGRRIAPTIVGTPRRTSGMPNSARSLATTKSHPVTASARSPGRRR